jgi:DNA-binding PadR family transcriptional regulator
MRDKPGRAGKFLPLTEAVYCILISLVEPMHGYGIMQNVSQISENGIKLGPGTLYGALNKLLESGLILRFGETESDGERRKLYILSDLGKEVLELEAERLAQLSRFGEQAVLKMRGIK